MEPTEIWPSEPAQSGLTVSGDFRLTRGVTLEPGLALDFATKMNFALGTSYQDVLDDPAVDAIILATPHTKHREQVEAAAARAIRSLPAVTNSWEIVAPGCPPRSFGPHSSVRGPTTGFG